MVKTTGYEFKKFFSDESYWFANGNKNTYYDDSEILIGDIDMDHSGTDIDMIDDTERVTINEGYVSFDNGEDMPLETFFKNWKKKQKTSVFAVECAIGKYDDIIAAIKTAGGKIIK